MAAKWGSDEGLLSRKLCFGSCLSSAVVPVRRFLASTQEQTSGQPLTLTEAHRMRVAEIREELERRDLDSKGTRPVLLERLKNAIREARSVKTLGQTKGKRLAEKQVTVLLPENEYIVQVKSVVSFPTLTWGAGIVVIDPSDGLEILEASKYFGGDRSSIQAEYEAAILGIRYAMRNGARRVKLQMSYDVVVNQITGAIETRGETIKVLYWKVMDMKESLSSFSIEAISASDNRKAGLLATRALATLRSVDMDERDDRHDSSCSPRIEPSKTYVLRVDGGARTLPPGCAGAGVVIYDDTGEEIWCGWKFFNTPSNNAAEYFAIILGLQRALSLGIRKVRAEGDSLLVVRQLLSMAEVKSGKLVPFHTETTSLMKEFESCDIYHIMRDKNKRAHMLATLAMDVKYSHGFDELEVNNQMKDALALAQHETQIDATKTYLLRFDGGSRGNPGRSGAGVVLYDDTGEEVWSEWKVLDSTTNNAAEYTALVLGLRRARSLGIRILRVEGDSELVIKQMLKLYRVNNRRLKPLSIKASELSKEFQSVKFRHIPREENKRADQLANMAMDSNHSRR